MFSNSASSHSREKIVTFELIEKPCECAFEREGREGWLVCTSIPHRRRGILAGSISDAW